MLSLKLYVANPKEYAHIGDAKTNSLFVVPINMATSTDSQAWNRVRHTCQFSRDESMAGALAVKKERLARESTRLRSPCSLTARTIERQVQDDGAEVSVLSKISADHRTVVTTAVLLHSRWLLTFRHPALPQNLRRMRPGLWSLLGGCQHRLTVELPRTFPNEFIAPRSTHFILVSHSYSLQMEVGQSSLPLHSCLSASQLFRHR